MSSDDLVKGIQSIDLKILNEFKRICENHNLNYFAIGGTCIGAVRHKGFIPWDDDIDVAMPFQDYLKFKMFAAEELRSPYALYDQHINKHTSHMFLKIHDESTAFVPDNCVHLYDRYMGVSFDIMPIYGLPEDETIQHKIMNMCKSYRINNRMLRMPISVESSIKMKLYWLFRSPLRIVLPYDYYGKKQEEEFGQYSFDRSDYVLFGWRSIPNRTRFYREDFDDFIEMPFEDTYIRVPKGYDRYLKMDFGNYMELPPVEERKSTHVPGVIDLKVSYKEYLKKEKEGI